MTIRTLLLCMLICSGCASVKYEKLIYEDGQLVSVERGRYDRIGDQKISEASVPGAYIKGQEATSEMSKYVAEGIIEGVK